MKSSSRPVRMPRLGIFDPQNEGRGGRGGKSEGGSKGAGVADGEAGERLVRRVGSQKHCVRHS